MRRDLIPWWLLLCSAIGVGLGSVVTSLRGEAGPPPRAAVELLGQETVRIDGKDQILVEHAIENVGGRTLILGEVTTTCDCSSAQLSTSKVEPGAAHSFDRS